MVVQPLCDVVLVGAATARVEGHRLRHLLESDGHLFRRYTTI